MDEFRIRCMAIYNGGNDYMRTHSIPSALNVQMELIVTESIVHSRSCERGGKEKNRIRKMQNKKL